MRVVDARQRAVLDEARSTVWRDAWSGLALVALAGGAASVAAGVVGPPLPGPVVATLAWVLVGLLAGDGVNLLVAAVREARELRRMRRDTEFLDALVAVDEAMRRADELPHVRLRGRS